MGGKDTVGIADKEVREDGDAAGRGDAREAAGKADERPREDVAGD